MSIQYKVSIAMYPCIRRSLCRPIPVALHRQHDGGRRPLGNFAFGQYGINFQYHITKKMSVYDRMGWLSIIRYIINADIKAIIIMPITYYHSINLEQHMLSLYFFLTIWSESTTPVIQPDPPPPADTCASNQCQQGHVTRVTSWSRAGLPPREAAEVGSRWRPHLELLPEVIQFYCCPKWPLAAKRAAYFQPIRRHFSNGRFRHSK